MEEYLLLGYVTDSFGLDGTLKVLSKTQFADKRYQIGNKISLFNKNLNIRKEAVVEHFHHNGLFDFVKVDIINTKEEAFDYKNYEVQVVKNNSDLEEGFFYFSDLENCEVYDENNNLLGKVTVVEEFPAQVTLRVRKADKSGEFFVPFIKVFIKNIDIESKKITIKVIEGMLWK